MQKYRTRVEVSMKTVLLAISILLMLSGLVFAQTIFNSDGSSSNPVGGTTFNSDGSSSNPVGGTTFHSDGSSSTPVGGTTFHSDGSSSTIIGR